MQVLAVRQHGVALGTEEVDVPDVEQAHEERDVLLRGGTQEMLIHRVEAREELLEAPLRHDHEERTAQRNEKVGAESRLLDAPLALDADHRTQQAGHHQPKDKNPSHNLTL